MQHRSPLVVLALAAALTLGGCVGKSDTSSSAPGSAAAAQGVGSQLPADTKATLHVWYYFDPTAKSTMDKLADEFHKKYPNVDVQYLFVDFANLRNKVLTAATGQDGPDVLLFDPLDTAVLAKAGALADLTQDWSTFDGRSQYPDFALNKVDDKLYAVQAYVNTTALWYNADILKKIGVEPPKTADELGVDLQKAHGAGFDGIALCGKPTNECETQGISWLMGNGANYDSLSSPQTTQVLDRFAGWAKDGYIPKEVVSWDHPTASQKFATGKFAFVQAGNWDLAVVGKDLTFNWGVVPLPGAQVAPGGEGEAIGAYSKNNRLAWEYLASTFWSEAGQVIFANGRGSIPIRTDASKDSTVAETPHIDAWIQEIAKAGKRSPVTNGDLQKATQTIGQIWSGLISGQLTAAQAQKRMVDEISPQFK